MIHSPLTVTPEQQRAFAARARRVYDTLAQRAASFGAVVWHCSPSGTILAAPAASSTGDGSGYPSDIAEIISRIATDPASIPAPDKHRFFRVQDRVGSRCVAVNVAAIATDGPVQPERADRLAEVLAWSSKDAARREHDAQTVAQLSERLGQAYEETQALCRMAKVLNSESDPAKALGIIVDEIYATMPFVWMACRFGSQADCIDTLRGRLLTAGRLTCDPTDFAAHAETALRTIDVARASEMRQPADDALAAATGAEVLRAPITHDGRLVGMLLAGNKGGSDPALSSFETQFVEACARFLGVFHENAARFAEQRAVFMGMLKALTAAIDAKDPYTRGHSERVALLAEMTARAMGLPAEEVEQYRVAGLVHDVGKIGVPEAVLCKPGRLNDEEFAHIKKHPTIGHAILKDIAALSFALPGVLHHHEHWSGRGYPHGLVADAIPMLARVLTLADTFDAMSSTRSYRPALPRETVVAELANCAGKQFDPDLVKIFLSMDFAPFDRMVAGHTAATVKAAA